MSSLVRRHHDPERAQHRCNQVLEAAAICFAKSGFHGASMSQISKQAGMSAGHIYNYFASKDAIILAFVERESEYVTGLLHDLESRDDPLQAMLDEAETQIAEMLDPQPWHLPLELYAEASRNPVIAETLSTRERLSQAQLRNMIKAGRELRHLAVDDALLDSRVETITAYFQGLSIRALHRSTLDRVSMAAAFRVAMRALLLT